jgi:hypothetical protein
LILVRCGASLSNEQLSHSRNDLLTPFKHSIDKVETTKTPMKDSPPEAMVQSIRYNESNSSKGKESIVVRSALTIRH